MRVLIGYDGSECADRAIIDLQRAGLPADATAIVLTAADVFLVPENGDRSAEESLPPSVLYTVELARKRGTKAFEEAESLAARAGEKITALFPGWKVTSEARADSPHWAIIAKADEWKPDLVVVGSEGHTALGRFVLGSVSQKVLFESKCSVRICRGREEVPLNSPVKLVLGTDGSPDANAMIDVVASRFATRETHVKLITAYMPFHQYAVEPDVQMDQIQDMQALAAEKLTAVGIIVTTLVTDDDPKSFLLDEAERWDADCIFLGAKGHRFFERLLIGSVSSSVAARAHISVEVVRCP